MVRPTLIELEADLLEYLQVNGSLVADEERAATLARLFGVPTAELAAAWNRLAELELVAIETDPSGTPFMRLTERGVEHAEFLALEDQQTGRPRPWWVRFGLAGAPTRRLAWACCWISLLIAVFCIVYGFRNRLFWPGGLFILSALGYWLAIRWVDRHGTWG